MDLHADPAIFEMAVRALAEGNSIRATARIVQVDKDAVCAWLGASAAAPPHMRKEQGQPARFLLSSRTDRGAS
jgi:transposase-like protein